MADSCGYCGRELPPLDLNHAAVCAGCGLTWQRDDRLGRLALCADEDDIRRLVLAERARCAKLCEAIAEGHRSAAAGEKWVDEKTLGAWSHAADEFAQAAARIREGHD